MIADAPEVRRLPGHPQKRPTGAHIDRIPRMLFLRRVLYRRGSVAEAKSNDGLSVGTVLASIAGLLAAVVAVVYVGGGALLWLRLAQLHLPAGSVIAYLPREFLVSIGLRELVLPLVTIAVIVASLVFVAYDVASSRYWAAVSPRIHLMLRTRVWRAFWLVVRVAFVGVLLLYGLLGWTELSRSEKILTVIALSVLAGGLTFVKEVKRAYGQNEASVAQAGAIAVLGFTLACVPTVILYADVRWSPQRAVVCMARGEPIAADYIGEASDRIYLGERFLYKNKKERPGFARGGDGAIQVISAPHIVSIEKSQATRVFIGENLLAKGFGYYCGRS
jgi:hypothetical protein